MMKFIKHFVENFLKHAHEVGAIYYAWVLLSAITGTLYTVYKQLSTPQIQGTSEAFFLAFVAAGVIWLALLPVLVVVIITKVNNKKHVVANPNITIKSRQVSYVVREDGLVKSQTLHLEAATGQVNSFRFSLNLSGTGTARITNLGGGIKDVLGPIERAGYDQYELAFTHPLEKGGNTTISFTIEISDPDHTMRHFLADRFHNALSYGAFNATYFFEKPPARVFSEHGSISGESLGDIRMLTPRNEKNGVLYELSVPKIDDHCVYTVTWI